MTLELDHVLVFVDPAVPEAAALEAAGFTVNPVHPHPGQGTANRALGFADSYLELIYLTSRIEAEGNVMRLDRRADWARTGASPFGFGLRGTLPPGARTDFWAYHPPYAPNRPPIWVHRSHHEAPHLPLVFVMEPTERRPLAAMRPSAWAPPDRICRAHGATGIAQVTLALPGASDWPAAALLPDVCVVPSGGPHATLILASRAFPAVDAGELLRLTSAS